MDKQKKSEVLRQLFAETKDPVLFANIRQAAGLNNVNMHDTPSNITTAFGGPSDILRSKGKVTLSADRFANLLIAGTRRWLENQDFNPNQYEIEVRDGKIIVTMKEEWT